MTYTNQAEGFFHRHRIRVFRYLRRAVGSADVAEDLSQEVFLRIVRGLPAYEERQLQTAWVFRIVRRVLASQGRARLRLVKWPTSALCAGLGLTAGVIVGVLLAPVGPPRDAVLPAARPAPAAVAAAVPAKPPGPASALAGAPPPAPVRKVVPPAARSVYRFEVGRNWREGS